MRKLRIVILTVASVVLLTGASSAQISVPGFGVEAYVLLEEPADLTFDGQGVLFVGHDSVKPAPGPVRRVAVGGSPVSNYGGILFPDPDGVAFDCTGMVTGMPGALIVANGLSDGRGELRVVRPDESVFSLTGGPISLLQNPNHVEIDSQNRLIIVDDNDINASPVYAFTGGVFTHLFTVAARASSISIGPGDRMAVGNPSLGAIQVYAADGSLVNPLLVSGLGTYPQAAYGPGGAVWGTDLYVISRISGELWRVDPQGGVQVVGTGFGDVLNTAMEFGPDGALYISRHTTGEVIRIASSTGTAFAGDDQSVPEGALVTLDGSGISTPCAAPSYTWTQLAGPGVVLAGSDTPQPTFTAPLLPGGFGRQTLTFQLTVSNTAGSSTDTVDVMVVNVNQPPVAVASGPASVREGGIVALSGANSFDPDGDLVVSHAWEQTGGPKVVLSDPLTATPSFTAPLLAGGVGAGVALTFRLTVSDGALSDTDTVTVNVTQENQRPTADAGPDQPVAVGTMVTLNGKGSKDPDEDPLRYQWVQVGGPSVSLSDTAAATPSFTAPEVDAPTSLTFRLTVDDTVVAGEPDEVVIMVVRPDDPPQCTLAQASPGLLWPPNHKMVLVGITGVTDPNNDAVAITITGVTQDEPVNGLGDGDTSPDAVLQGDSVLIRAERSGRGSGRVYRISFTGDDGQGRSCAGVVTVGVPHSMKPGGTPIDDGQFYDSTQP